MRQDDRLLLPLDVVALLACEHIDLSLVQTQLTHVGTQEEDISALHGGLEHLCSF